MDRIQAHGKLLISSEYMVMYGSKALAVPLRKGQMLQKYRSDNPRVFSWKAFYGEQSWFHALYDPSSLRILESSDRDRAVYLQQLIRSCIEMMPAFQEDLFNWDVETRLDFSPDWGLGSSSTLVALLAEWAEVNPLDLHFSVSSGSGFDVACAIADGPLIYRLRDGSPTYLHVPFHPPFSRHLHFAWLGRKQPTEAHLKEVSGRINPDYQLIHRFTELTEQMLNAQELSIFQDLMETHESQLAGILGMEPVSGSVFRDIPGSVKSLGAWGGDFVLIASEAPREELEKYLGRQGIHQIFSFDELVYYGTEPGEEPPA